MPAFAIPKLPTAFANQPPSKKTRRIEDPAHLAFIRKLPSIISGAMDCQACHIRAASAVHRKKMTGLGQKPDDAWTLPLTADEHRQQHSGNEIEFWDQYGIDPFDAAVRLYAVTGDLEAGARVIASIRVRGGANG